MIITRTNRIDGQENSMDIPSLTVEQYVNENTKIERLGDLHRDALRVVADWCVRRYRELDPIELERLEAGRKAMLEHERKCKIAEDKMKLIVKKLREVIKPGMILKMKGCKDGFGLRKFIQWDDKGNLICWQLRKQVIKKPGHFSSVTVKTNQITQHMPDKVTKMWIDGKEVSLKSIL